MGSHDIMTGITTHIPALTEQPDPERYTEAGVKHSATVRRMYDAMYAGNRYIIVRRLKLPVVQSFRTREGRKGRCGWVIKNIDTAEQEIVGDTVLRRIAEWYGGVTLPAHGLRRSEPQRRVLKTGEVVYETLKH